jgi:hypothetical protein
MWAGGPPKPVTPIRVHSRATVASDARAGDGPAPRVGRSAGGLEELDRVAGGVIDEDLPSARAGHDVVAKLTPASVAGVEVDGVLDVTDHVADTHEIV